MKSKLTIYENKFLFICSDILEIYGTTELPAPRQLSGLIAKKKETELHLQKYRLGLNELEASVKKIDE